MNREMLITLPRRGLRVIPPPETQDNMRKARAGQIVSWSDEEKKRLKLLTHCSILTKRYPTPQDGQRFMQGVNYEWGKELLGMAHETTDEIVSQWNTINPHTDIAVLLYGSITKGLVKNPDNPDPSNIDIAVIGNIGFAEREELFDAIRPKREEIRERILSKCPAVHSREPNPGNVGVIIQHTDKLAINNFGQARTYITAGARALYDPSGLWQRLEEEALSQMDLRKLNGKKKKAVRSTA